MQPNAKKVAQFLGLLSGGFVVSFAVLVVIGEAPIEWTGPPLISCGNKIKEGGGDICGTASGANVSVSAHLNGGDDPGDQVGETDTSQMDGVNCFCFSTDSLIAGDWVELRAIDHLGETTYDYVDIVDCP